jgi:cyclomaltodextrinase / maltogenic alpha-amylase / neopullulanase
MMRNSWNGSEHERLGDAAEVFALLTFTVPGMPLIYSGQETGLTKRLRFFDKDTIIWGESNWTNIYSKFCTLKEEHPVFWNGTSGGSFNGLSIKGSKKVFVFERINDTEHAIVMLNLSNKQVDFKLKDGKSVEGDYIEYFTKEEPKTTDNFNLPAYGYKVLIDEL